MDRRIQLTIGLIDREFNRTLEVNKLAVDVNLSPSHFRHLFRKETGTTLAKYVLNKRMNEARDLLDTTYLSVKEIMNLVGIYDDSHFAHSFKAKHGVSASRYVLGRL
jgi:transcriptional regulator GlxA family with amidase domain